jgi:hypothetical protein
MSFGSIAVWWKEDGCASCEINAAAPQAASSNSSSDTPSTPTSSSMSTSNAEHEKWTFLCFECSEFRTEYIGIPMANSKHVKRLLQHKLHYLTHTNIAMAQCNICSTAASPEPLRDTDATVAADWFCITDFVDDYYRQNLLTFPAMRPTTNDPSGIVPATWQIIRGIDNSMLLDAMSPESKALNNSSTIEYILPWLATSPYVAPASITPKQALAIARYRGGSIPSLSWKHPKTMATLCRATAVAITPSTSDEQSDDSDDDTHQASPKQSTSASPSSSSSSAVPSHRCADDEYLINEIRARSKTDLMHFIETGPMVCLV